MVSPRIASPKMLPATSLPHVNCYRRKETSAALPPLFCWDIDEVQLYRQASRSRESSKFGPTIRLAEAEVQHARNVPSRGLQRDRPYLRHATLNTLHRPCGVEWLGAIHPEQRSHPFIDRKSDTLQTIAQPQCISCLAGTGRAADKVDKVMLHGLPSSVPAGTDNTPRFYLTLPGLPVLSAAELPRAAMQ
jgi:hypothetical protein